MKTANFTWKSPKRNLTIYGKVTLKDDGNVSVSMPSARFGTSMAERSQAKQLALDIVKADFKHEAVTSFHETKVATGLVAALTEKTQELKESFLEQTRQYAKRLFADCEAKKNRTEREWLDAYHIAYKLVDKYGQKEYPEVAPGHRKRVAEMRNAKERVDNIYYGGVGKLMAQEVKQAERHYEDSIIKLAYALNQKGIVDGSSFEVATARVGINLEITITHSEGVTRAFTVWANGPINRPHYRYLVK